MPQLPTPGGSSGSWGQELNDFLNIAHNTNGTVKQSAIVDLSTDLAAKQDALPSQTGNSGKVLGTKGSVLSWEASVALTNGSGTTANGSAVDLGGQMTGDVIIDTGSSTLYKFIIGRSSGAAKYLEIDKSNNLYGFGDVDYDYNGSKFIIDDYAQTITATAATAINLDSKGGVTTIGDVENGNGDGSSIAINYVNRSIDINTPGVTKIGDLTNYNGGQVIEIGGSIILGRPSSTSITINSGDIILSQAQIIIPFTVTYADNAAAITGGLIAGMLYKTATGQLMIVY